MAEQALDWMIDRYNPGLPSLDRTLFQSTECSGCIWSNCFWRIRIPIVFSVHTYVSSRSSTVLVPSWNTAASLIPHYFGGKEGRNPNVGLLSTLVLVSLMFCMECYQMVWCMLFRSDLPSAHQASIDVGGKLLTNHLKELVSYRQWNMMDETSIVNDVEEKTSVHF